jgi:hypothetical protein
MTETSQTPPYTLASDEKVNQVMVYTNSAMFWGEVVTKQIIRVSTWLRTNTAPDRICIYNARAIYTFGGAQVRPMQFSELYIATSQINLFHLKPPTKDPLDYDPTEPNRRMQPVSILISNFRVDGNLRLASKTSLGKSLEVTRESFSAVYDAQISSSLITSFGNLAVPYVLVRQEAAVFTLP